MKKKCICGGSSVEKRDLDVFDATGLLQSPFEVYLHDAVTEVVCSDCGSTLYPIIPRPQLLIAVVVVLRALDSPKLFAHEVRFLRKALGPKAKDVAAKLGVSPEHLSRWENGKAAISESAERLLRALVCMKHIQITHRLGVRKFSEVAPEDFWEMKIVTARKSTDLIRYDLRYPLGEDASENLYEPVTLAPAA